MDPKLQHILDKELKELQREISDPDIMANHLRQLTEIDKECVHTNLKSSSRTHAVHTLVSRLKKRGPDAFTEFVQVLYENDHKPTATRLREKARKVGIEIPLGKKGNNDGAVISRGPIAAATTSSTSSLLQNPITEEHRGASSIESTLTPDLGQGKSEASPVTQTNLTLSFVCDKTNEELMPISLSKDSLLKDIPAKLTIKIMTKLQATDSSSHSGWEGLAGECGYSYEELQELRGHNKPMQRLFERMAHEGAHVCNLLDKLKSMGRQDIVSDIESQFDNTEVPGIENNDLLSKADLPSPSQESSSGDPSKESTDDNKKPKLPKQESESNEDQEEMSILTPLPDNQVFLSAIRNGKALLLSVEKYENLPTFNRLRLLYQLGGSLEYHGWEVIKTGRTEVSSSATIKRRVEEYCNSVENDDACFIYLAGHTVQINAENYLLPSEVDLNNTTAADIMDISLNINALLEEITEHRQALVTLLFVDGAFDTGVVQCAAGNVITTGLAPIAPLKNAAIAFPCNPAVIRQMDQEKVFLEAILTILRDDEREHLTAAELFSELKARHPTTTVFALSPKTILPFYIYSTDGPKLLEFNNGVQIPQYALIFFDDTCENQGLEAALMDHLRNSLEQLEWRVEVRRKSECDQNLRDLVRNDVRNLGGDDIKLVMIYFIGFQANDQHSLAVAEDQPCINIKWVTNLMCEFINGPKLVIVGDSTRVVTSTLDEITPIPADVLISLPTEKPDEDQSPEIDSFTVLLAQNLSQNRNRTLRNIITTTADRWEYQNVKTSLFYA